MKKETKNGLKKLGMGVCLLCTLSFSACNEGAGYNEADTVEEAEVVSINTEVDAADDGMFDSNEFNTSFTSTNYFEDWDMNDDNFLDENEFNESYYNVWDTDNDGILEETEWNDDIKNFGLTDESWDTWDANNDDQVDKNEFNTALDDNNYYSTWDVDKNSQLTEREYTDGLFGLWDDNDDGFVEKERYDNYYNSYFGS